MDATPPPSSQSVQPRKVLIVYYSLTGKTQGVAEDLARRCEADIERITDTKKRTGWWGGFMAGKDASQENLTTLGAITKNPADYDLVIIGTPVWAWNMTPAVRTYIGTHKDSFKSVAFFVTAGGTPADKIVAKMAILAGKPALASAGFVQDDFKPAHTETYEQKMTAFVNALTGQK